MTTTLELADVHKHFRSPQGPIRAVDGISLTIRPGEIVAFLGPNGAGKTTTIDMMLGLTEPTSGTIKVLGGSARKAVQDGQIAAVLQTGGLLRDLSVGETVRSIAALQKRLHRAKTVLEEADLAHLAHRKVSKCSGGEQQRLKFALALITEPSLLILDEPTTGMDVNVRSAFWQKMRRQATSGRTIVFATHYLEEAQEFAQRIILLGHGRVLADGPTAEIRSLTGGRTVQASFEHLVTDDDLTESESIRTLSQSPGVTRTVFRGGRVTFTTTRSDELAGAILAAGGRDLTITEPSLEQVFMTLTTAKQEQPA